MMSASFFVFGEGEWQSHLVRIWPLFLLFLLVFWFVRRRWHSAVAWFAVGMTATLPTALPALAACARGSAREADFENILSWGSPSRFLSRRLAGLGSGFDPR